MLCNPCSGNASKLVFLAVRGAPKLVSKRLIAKGWAAGDTEAQNIGPPPTISHAPHVRLSGESRLQYECSSMSLLTVDYGQARGDAVLVCLKGANHTTTPHGFGSSSVFTMMLVWSILCSPRISRTTGCNVRGERCFRYASESSQAVQQSSRKTMLQTSAVL